MITNLYVPNFYCFIPSSLSFFHLLLNWQFQVEQSPAISFADQSFFVHSCFVLRTYKT